MGSKKTKEPETVPVSDSEEIDEPEPELDMSWLPRVRDAITVALERASSDIG